MVQKDTTNPTGIIVLDSIWYDASPPNQYGFAHHCTLGQADSVYVDGAQQGKFVAGDSLRVIVPASICGSGHIYYLKKLTAVGFYTGNEKVNSCTLFPNPSQNSINILIPGYSEKLKASIIDVNGKPLLEREFVSKAEIDVGLLPRGIYLVQVSGADIHINKRLLLID